MKLLKLTIIAAFVAALALSTASRFKVEGQSAIQEAPTTDLNVLTDDLFNGLGNRGTPIDECVGAPVANRSFEDNKFIFEEREGAEDGLGPTYNDTACSSCHQNTRPASPRPTSCAPAT